jgi:Phosducin.
MADLEERILKKNVPGKYSQWTDHYYYEEEDKVPRHQGIDESKESAIHNFHTDDFQLDNIKSNNARYGRTRHNTGVKGVLSDRHRAKELEKINMQEEQLERKAFWERMTCGSVLDIGEQSMSIAFEKQQQQQQKNQRRDLHQSDLDSHSDDVDSDDTEDDDYDYFTMYRQKRLSELTQQRSLPSFGFVTEIDSANQFSSMIDEADQRTFLIFHLYDSRVPCCRLMNDHLDQIARDWEYCRVFRMKVSNVKDDFDPIGFPCILVYRDGEEVANLTPIVESENRDRFTVEDIQEILMQSCGLPNSMDLCSTCIEGHFK